jgi:hypothetical protein
MLAGFALSQRHNLLEDWLDIVFLELDVDGAVEIQEIAHHTVQPFDLQGDDIQTAGGIFSLL